MNMENSKDLRCKLKIAERSEEIISEIEKSRCPVCGGKLKYESRVEPSDYHSYAYGKIFCTRCNTFSIKTEKKSYEAYHWLFDGSSDLTLLEETFSKLNYIKQKNRICG